jgi:hypothetical protein
MVDGWMGEWMDGWMGISIHMGIVQFQYENIL